MQPGRLRGVRGACSSRRRSPRAWRAGRRARRGEASAEGPVRSRLLLPAGPASRRHTRHRHLVAHGRDAARAHERSPHHPGALPLGPAERQADRGLRPRVHAARPRAEAWLEADRLGARHDRHRRHLRPVAGCGHVVCVPAVQRLAEGRLRDRPDRLPGARHARDPPVPDRPRRGALGRRRRARRPAPVPEHRPALRDRRALAGRPVGAVRGRRVGARRPGPRVRRRRSLRAGVASQDAGPGRGGADQARRWTERARRADPDGRGRRVAGGRPARAAHAGGVRAGPGGPARVHGGAVGAELVGRARAGSDPAPGRRPDRAVPRARRREPGAEDRRAGDHPPGVGGHDRVPGVHQPAPRRARRARATTSSTTSSRALSTETSSRSATERSRAG